MKSFGSSFVAAVLFLGFSSAAQAAPHGILWARGKAPSSGVKLAGAGKLLYYGGPVIANAKVYAVFWGNGVDSEIKEKIGPFYANIMDSTYLDWLSEYDTSLAAVDGRQGTNQHIGRGSYAGAITISPANTSTDLTDAMIQAELEAQVAAGKLPAPSDDTLYMINFPAGTNISIDGQRSCQSFCAYHEGFKAKSGAAVYYGVLPVCGGFGCGGGSAFDNLCSAASHEAIEAVTDPFPTPGDKPAYPQAWNTNDGQEIADLCVGNNSTVSGHGTTSTVQQLWDNNTNSCAAGPWSQAATASASPVVAPKVQLSWKPGWVAPVSW